MVGVVRRIRISFFSILFFGTLLISREYFRQEQRVLLYNNNAYNDGATVPLILLRDTSLVDRPTTLRRRTKHVNSTTVLTERKSSSGYLSASDARVPSRTIGGEVAEEWSIPRTTRDNDIITNTKENLEMNNYDRDEKSTAQQTTNSPKGRLERPQRSNPPVHLDRPNDDNTAIALVAMGTVIDTWLVERCLLSIRNGGEFRGTVIVLTDQSGHEKYSETLYSIQKTLTNTEPGNLNNQVIVMKTREEDTKPKKENGATIGYYKKRPKMLYKRYKTLVLEYVQATSHNAKIDDLSQRISYVLYLDVDNLVTRPLSTFFEDYFESTRLRLAEAPPIIEALSNNNSQADVDSDSSFSTNATLLSTRVSEKNTTTDLSFFSFWRDPHVKHKGVHLWQSGQIMISTHHSAGCLNAWRHEMDYNRHVMDQALLFNVYVKNFSEHRCLFFELPDGNSPVDESINRETTDDKDAPENKHFQLLSKETAKANGRNHYPTIVHLTEARLNGLGVLASDKLVRFLKRSLFHEERLTLPSGSASKPDSLRLEPKHAEITWNGTTFSWDEIILGFATSLETKRINKARNRKKKKNEQNQ